MDQVSKIYSREAEMDVIGSMLYDPTTIPIALEIVSEDHFFFLPYKLSIL